MRTPAASSAADEGSGLRTYGRLMTAIEAMGFGISGNLGSENQYHGELVLDSLT